MTATTHLDQLIGKLIQKTEVKELNWSAVKNGFELDMSDITVRVTNRGEGSDSDYVLELLTDDGVVIDSCADVAPSGPEHGRVSKLYSLAQDRTRTAAIERLSAALEKQSQPDPEPKFTLPTTPSEDDKSAVFRAIQGLWRLEDSRGQEYARIFPTGDYSVRDHAKREHPKYKFRLIAINRADKKIELAKDTLDNKRLQIEVLQLDDMDQPTRMEGEAKHDRHHLLYTLKSRT